MSGEWSDWKEKIRELISILMESGYYFDLSPRDRLSLIHFLIRDMDQTK